jgi:hypothetical protein
MSFNLDEFYNKLNSGNVLLAFRGSISTEVINTILESVEAKLTGANEDIKIIRKMYNVLVESLQNLYHHIDDFPQLADFGAKFCIVVIVKTENGYKVTTGNFIIPDKIKVLKDKIDKINSLNDDDLKDMYKFILNHQKLSAKGGGGLGLVDIARKTKNKLEYLFQNYNDDFYFFNLDILIS